MTFKRKLLLAFSVMIVPLVIIGAQALWNIRQENLALRTLEVGLSRVRIFAELESVVYRQIRKIRDYLTGWDEEAREEFERLDQAVHKQMEEWKQAVSYPEDVQLAEDLERLHGGIKDLARRAFTLYELQKKEEAIQLIQQELNSGLLPVLDGTIKKIYQTSRAHNVQSALQRLEALERSTRMVLILIVLSSIVSVALFSILISRNLARPVEELKRAMDIVGEGRLDYTIEVRSQDEIGGLARSFIHMTEKLKKAQEAMTRLNADLQQKIKTLKETQDQLIQSEKLASIGQMSAAVAHGLRNPLASIRAATQLSLHHLPPGDPVQEHLQAVIAEVDRLEKRISHLLDFTKPVPFHPVPEKATRLVEGALSTFSEKITQQGIHLKVDLQEDLPEVWVDPSQIEQALLEVISNSLEAMPKGGTLTISTFVTPPFLEVIITDTGEGVPKDALPHVFEPFFTTKADGTGLGLAIAKRFIEQNKGTLTISSRLNEGTSMRITLPITS